MSSIDDDAKFEMVGRTPDETPPLDPRIAARVSRLLRWYPSDWRERYGEEFEEVLASSISDGKGSLRLSLDVAREGVTSRLKSAGYVGRSAPVLERARASVITLFVAILGFLSSTAVLAYYVKGWQRTPVLESLSNAEATLSRSTAFHTYQQTMMSPTYRRLQYLAVRSHNPNSQAWKIYYKFQTNAQTTLNKSDAGRAYHQALSFHPATGAPVVFNDISHIATIVAIGCIAIALIFVAGAAVRIQWRVERRRIVVPLGFLSTSAVSFVLGAAAYQAFQKIPLGQPGSELQALRWLLAGNFRFWPAVVFPLCALASIVFAVIGGVQLMRRVDFLPRTYRLQGFLAAVAAGSLCVAVISTLLWVTTLRLEASDFLTAKDGGVLGTSLLPVLSIVVVVMIGTSWTVVVGSARCLRSVRGS